MGERRRVAIATVLAMEPALLVLDEPSANLDPRSRRELLDVLATLEQTMLVVTHDLPFAAELCERAVILAGGRIVEDGDCDRILADKPLLAAHDLELPVGFDLSGIERLPKPSQPRSASDCAPASDVFDVKGGLFEESADVGVVERVDRTSPLSLAAHETEMTQYP
jgi:cobalt/nickel transport system ATP-binding protein